jgi:hypothetical protein
MNIRQKKRVHKRTKKKDVVFHKRPRFSPRRADLSSQVPPGFNVKVVSMVSALWSASGWVINPHNSLRTKLTVLHQDATPIQRPFLTEVRNAFNSMDINQSGNQIYEHENKKTTKKMFINEQKKDEQWDKSGNM